MFHSNQGNLRNYNYHGNYQISGSKNGMVTGFFHMPNEVKHSVNTLLYGITEGS